jgi:hypothetical protein
MPAPRRANLTCQLMEELQDRWLLLHGSLQQRVAHFPRGCPWQHVGHAVQGAENKAVDGVFARLGLPREFGPNRLGTIAAVQSTISWHSARTRGNALMDSYDASTDRGKRASAFSAAPAVRLQLGWSLSRSRELWSSRAERSRPASGTVLA